MHLTILYRGSLASCNYGCVYCPFAKRVDPADALAADRLALERFQARINELGEHRFSILFTPWGEALIHRTYQQNLARLSWAANIEKVAIQTNLSCSLNWLSDCDPTRLALWCTFHPDWSNPADFLARCRELDKRGVRYSVGVVGFARFRDHIAALRQELPPHVYLWINAVKNELDGLTPQVRQFFSQIDPLYELNTQHHQSLDSACRAGHKVFSVDGEGTMRRCHFIREPIGNFYSPDWDTALQPRPCSNATCHCHIGYVHLEYLQLDRVFASGLLERIPSDWPETNTLFAQT
jgi:hypothetical protein